MKTQQEIIAAVLNDQAVTDAVLAISASYKSDADLPKIFPHYFRVSAALSDVINALDLSGVNAPESAKGISKFIPFVAIGMPGFSGGFTAHWGDGYLISQGEDPMFFEELGKEARAEGEAGNPNYLHGLLVVDLAGDLLVQMSGTSLMMAAAANIEKGLAEVKGSGSMQA